MGGLAEAQLQIAVEALVRRDPELARQRSSGRQAHRRARATRSASSPCACSRCASRWPTISARWSAALKIASDLERIGDYAKNIAKRAIALSEAPGRSPRCTPSRAWPRWCRASSRTCSTPMSRTMPTEGDRGLAARRGSRRDVHQPVPRAADLHDGGPAQHRLLHPSACSSPRTSSASAITPPTSPRWSISWCMATPWTEARPKGDTTNVAVPPWRRPPPMNRNGAR